MRFVFSPPAGAASGLLTLPWREPLEQWQDERMVEIRQRGLSRHVVRFVAEGGAVYALKEIGERLARKEYRLLRRLGELGVPAVEAMGVVVDRPDELDAMLVTRFLDYSSSYRALFASPRGGDLTGRLLDALVELLVRLHLAGFMWGDCSLSNTLFRFDAGAFAAYLVDAETSEMHPTLTDGQRGIDLDIVEELVFGDLLDLQIGGLLPAGIDPEEVAGETVSRYRALWAELAREEVLLPADQRYRISQRLRRINELGFDVDEVELVEAGEGSRLRLRTRVAEPGHHRRVLFARTGLVAGENQARRLLNDIASYRGYLERSRGRPVPDAVAASSWLTEVYEPVVHAIPEGLRDRLEEAEVFHEVLEHRWLMSEAAGRDIGTTAAMNDYFATILPAVPEDLTAAPQLPARPPPAPPGQPAG
jgi:tRNA A-37 threonylcarbamoyl transferase component Bud32